MNFGIFIMVPTWVLVCPRLGWIALDGIPMKWFSCLPFLPLFSPLTTTMNRFFLSLPNLTIIQIPHHPLCLNPLTHFATHENHYIMECVGYNWPLFMLKFLDQPPHWDIITAKISWLLLNVIAHIGLCASAKKIHPKPKIWCRVLVWSSFICDWNTWKVCVMCFLFFHNQQSSMS